MKRLVSALMMTACVGFGFCCRAGAEAKTERWAVYYTNVRPARDFLEYDTLVFDRDVHPPLKELKDKHRMLLAYLSLGEVERYRGHYGGIQEKKLILPADPAWKGPPLIDVRRAEWGDYIVNEAIPDILERGFNGIMLDTADSLIFLEKQNPQRFAGMQEGMVSIIKRIRGRYPDLKIMLNRGFELLPALRGVIDMSLAESTYTNWDLTKKKPGWVTPDIERYYLDILSAARKNDPQLAIYTLDYWPPEQSETVRKIYRTQRERGFIPYVSTPDLQNIFPEPAE